MPAFDSSIIQPDVTHIECSFTHLNSVLRGKVIPLNEFLSAIQQHGHFMFPFPSVAFGITLNGAEPPAVFGPLLPADYRDLQLTADLSTLRPSGLSTRLATILCEPLGSKLDCSDPDFANLTGEQLSPRARLRSLTSQFNEIGIHLRCAPELEFMLLVRADDQSNSAKALAVVPAGSTDTDPSRESEAECFSLQRTAQFQWFFEQLWDACQKEQIPMTAYAHEAAWGQYEVNFSPNDPVSQADAVVRFKRIVKILASREGLTASFMAKPLVGQPGNGMHWHLSLNDAHGDSLGMTLLEPFIAGVQRFGGAGMAAFAPFDHSYERIRMSDATPTTLSWGHNDRYVAMRIPQSDERNQRVEFRLPGADADPYLTLSALLACGLEGIKQQMKPTRPNVEVPQTLPPSLSQAIQEWSNSEVLRHYLGHPLIKLYAEVKRHESLCRHSLQDPLQWDARYLLEQS